MHHGWTWNFGKVILNFKLISESSLFHAPASQEYFHANPAQVVQPSFLLSLLYHVAGNFRVVRVNFRIFRGMLVNVKQKPRKFLPKNFRTWRWPSIIISRSLWISALYYLHCMTNIRHTLCKYKQQKNREGDRLASWFSSEVMMKRCQAYRDSWGTVLS